MWPFRKKKSEGVEDQEWQDEAKDKEILRTYLEQKAGPILGIRHIKDISVRVCEQEIEGERTRFIEVMGTMEIDTSSTVYRLHVEDISEGQTPRFSAISTAVLDSVRTLFHKPQEADNIDPVDDLRNSFTGRLSSFFVILPSTQEAIQYQNIGKGNSSWDVLYQLNSWRDRWRTIGIVSHPDAQTIDAYGIEKERVSVEITNKKEVHDLRPIAQQIADALDTDILIRLGNKHSGIPSHYDELYKETIPLENEAGEAQRAQVKYITACIAEKCTHREKCQVLIFVDDEGDCCVCAYASPQKV